MLNAAFDPDSLATFRAALERYQAAARVLDGLSGGVGAHAPYWFGIETGFTPDGQVARRVGGAHMFAQAADAVLPGAPAAVLAALPEGPLATVNAVRRVLDEARRQTEAKTPVVTGNLRASMFTTLDTGNY